MLNMEVITKIEYIIHALEMEGYNSQEQLLAYITTGGLSYITRKNNAREMIKTISKEDVSEYILKLL